MVCEARLGGYGLRVCVLAGDVGQGRGCGGADQEEDGGEMHFESF